MKRLLVLTSATGAGHDTHAAATVAWCAQLYGTYVSVTIAHALEDSHAFYRGAVGFYKTANGVVCKNCGAPINPQSVGTTGGCNPVPLKATQTADAVIIEEADVAAGSRMFAQP